MSKPEMKETGMLNAAGVRYYQYEPSGREIRIRV